MIFEIYTDGSSHIHDTDNKESSAAFTIYSNEKCIVKGGAYFKNGTNNKGEAMGILLALNCLDKRLKNVDTKLLKPPYQIYVYSDSLNTVNGCRSWIHSWIKKSKNGILYSSKNEPVINGEIFSKIYYDYIKNRNYRIKFMHVNSHVLDNIHFTKKENDIREYFQNPMSKKKLPKDIFKDTVFKNAKKSYHKINKDELDEENFLRILMHNKECDSLASLYLSSKGKKEGEIIVKT